MLVYRRQMASWSWPTHYATSQLKNLVGAVSQRRPAARAIARQQVLQAAGGAGVGHGYAEEVRGLALGEEVVLVRRSLRLASADTLHQTPIRFYVSECVHLVFLGYLPF